MLDRGLLSQAVMPFWAGLMAICIAAAAYAVAPTVSQALSFHAVTNAKALIVAPVIEELFFRGVVQSRLRAQVGVWGRPWIAIGVTAACFGFAHLATASLTHAAMVIAPACVIGWAYERTRSIGLCILLHSAANAFWMNFWSV
ncbi:MAG: JDVT-CTERM system glutamic-type intramembrane protease [Burkholderiaceae bacterium]